MSIADYVSFLHGLISATPFVTATSLSFEERPPSAGSINGTIRFIDGSQLDFKEFVIIQPRQEVIKYGYHYRMSDRLIFRYDKCKRSGSQKLSDVPAPQAPAFWTCCRGKNFIRADITRNRFTTKDSLSPCLLHRQSGDIHREILIVI